MTAGAVVTAVEVVGHIAACCAAEKVVTVEAGLATYEMEDSRDPDSDHQASYLLVPCQMGSCPEAYRCSVDDGAFGQVGEAYAVDPSATGPCCSGVQTVGGTTEAPSAVLVFVASVQACHTDYRAS